MPPVASTSESTEMTSTPGTKKKHHGVRPGSRGESYQSIADLLRNSTEDELSLPQIPYSKKNQLDERIRTGPYGTSFFGRSNQTLNHQSSLAGVFVLIFVLIGILLVLILFYFLAKVCSTSTDTRKRKIKTKNGTVIVRDKNPIDVEAVPTTVPLPKRIYELKAEEGYYSCPPAIENNFIDIFEDVDDEYFSPSENPQSPEKSPQKQLELPCERKLTGFGMPPGFKPKGRLQELIHEKP